MADKTINVDGVSFGTELLNEYVSQGTKRIEIGLPEDFNAERYEIDVVSDYSSLSGVLFEFTEKDAQAIIDSGILQNGNNIYISINLEQKLSGVNDGSYSPLNIILYAKEFKEYLASQIDLSDSGDIYFYVNIVGITLLSVQLSNVTVFGSGIATKTANRVGKMFDLADGNWIDMNNPVPPVILAPSF